MKIAQFDSNGSTIILSEKTASNNPDVLRLSEWIEVEFTPRVPPLSEQLAALEYQEKTAKDWLKRIQKDREALSEPADEDEPDEPREDGECFRGGEAAAYLAEQQDRIQRTLK